MLIDATLRDKTGQGALRAQVEEYDAAGFPDRLLLDDPPGTWRHDRLAVAAAILFGQRASGRLWFENPVSPLVATAIHEALPSANLNVGPIDFKPSANLAGDGTLAVRLVGCDTPVSWQEMRRASKGAVVALSIARTDQAGGSLRGTFESTMATNAWLFVNRLVTAGEVAAALGVVYAETFFTDRIRISADLPAEVEQRL
ncbi:MAG: hypothetical protein LBG70_04935, partial [Bifidobacteriaceae bacterium]|nr:hypothetical protein [Bifidobacteriaceae bacterium]